MTIVDNNNCIPSGLRADIMRQSMENKNLLSTKGSIYVGTGESVTINGEKIYKTKALALGAEGEILQVKNGDLGYGKIQNAAVDGSANYTNLANSLKKIPLQNAQFDPDLIYDELIITDDNIEYSEVDSPTTNIRIIPQGGMSCEIQCPSSDYTRTIYINQNSQGKLALSYGSSSGAKNLYKHEILLRFKFFATLNEYDTKQTNAESQVYMFFSFVNTKSTNYPSIGSSNKNLTLFLSALLGEDLENPADTSTWETRQGRLQPKSIDGPELEGGASFDYYYKSSFYVKKEDGSYGIKVFYYDAFNKQQSFGPYGADDSRTPEDPYTIMWQQTTQLV